MDSSLSRYSISCAPYTSYRRSANSYSKNPLPPESYSLDLDDYHDDNDPTGPGPSTSTDPDFKLPHSSPKCHLISQSELNDLVRDLELPKSKAELLGFKLQQWNLVESDVKVHFFVIAKRTSFHSS